MSSPLIEWLSPEEARQELSRLKHSVATDWDDFIARAHSYNLSSSELELWERVQELTWLLERV